jgi:hypothetical protein
MPPICCLRRGFNNGDMRGGFDLGIKHHNQQYYPIPHAFGFVLLSVFGFIFIIFIYLVLVLVLGV